MLAAPVCACCPLIADCCWATAGAACLLLLLLLQGRLLLPHSGLNSCCFALAYPAAALAARASLCFTLRAGSGLVDLCEHSQPVLNEQGTTQRDGEQQSTVFAADEAQAKELHGQSHCLESMTWAAGSPLFAANRWNALVFDARFSPSHLLVRRFASKVVWEMGQIRAAKKALAVENLRLWSRSTALKVPWRPKSEHHQLPELPRGLSVPSSSETVPQYEDRCLAVFRSMALEMRLPPSLQLQHHKLAGDFSSLFSCKPKAVSPVCGRRLSSIRQKAIVSGRAQILRQARTTLQRMLHSRLSSQYPGFLGSLRAHSKRDVGLPVYLTMFRDVQVKFALAQ